MTLFLLSVIVGNIGSQPIQILRDTGASHTLLLEGVLPLSQKTFVVDSVLVQGLELVCIMFPSIVFI